ncbi:MAG: Mycothiol S-conjugate amidase [Gemmatimonadaceae bacterium]|nr:Mycothiol S-conjugate amidase [Gemmatimonadaceae bacterium]
MHVLRTIGIGLLVALHAATLEGQGSGAETLGPLVRGLSVSARVLVIGAHPDDEDTQLIAWLARGRSVETAYLSLTRGDGGQNIVGNDLGEALGAIRTEELLAARRVDGGRQYFTRAFDFGFSKNAAEAFTQWPHDSVLQDVVTVVRAFRPHVIVSVFSGTPRDGHGQHQVAGILAKEAYDLAGDSVRFPSAVTAGLGPWSVSKFYRGAGFRSESGTISFNVGRFDPVLGRSYAEIAADSRSQHRSQAMGSLQRKGTRLDYLVRESMRVPAPEDPREERSIFDGVDTTWNRFRARIGRPAGLTALDSLIDAVAALQADFDLFAPGKSVPALATALRLARAVCGSPILSIGCAMRGRYVRGEMRAVQPDVAASMDETERRLEAALVAASGVAVEATASREVWALGERIPVAITVYNRGVRPITLDRWVIWQGMQRSLPSDGPAPVVILPDSAATSNAEVMLEEATEPWWLTAPRHGSMFTPRILGVAEGDRPSAATAGAIVMVEGVPVIVEVPVVYRRADPVRGDVSRPIAGAPAVTLTLDRDAGYAPADGSIHRPLSVRVRSAASVEREVTITVDLPAGLLADSVSRTVKLPAGAQRTVAFDLRGRLLAGRHAVRVSATSGGKSYASGYHAIEYDYIGTQRLYRPSVLELEAVNVNVPPGLTVAYINGVGDNSAAMLEQLGVDVTIVDPATLPNVDLSRFGAVVVGTRAYEASDALVANNVRLLDYARNGGTLVVQYGQYEMQNGNLMPYPITLARPADRVTVEDAPVTIVDPSARILNEPNRIGGSDFRGWQQDLALYMPRTFDPAYVPSLEMNDPGEAPNRGALLVAPVGKGTYVYTTLAFFRQLPNGNPGAARLFVNLMAARASRSVP